MPENEFEKQVQQKMGELQLAPSPEAWDKVEKQIAVRKKRRRILVWLPLCFILLGGMAWFYGASDRTTAKNDEVGTNEKPAQQKNLELQQKAGESLSRKHATPIAAGETANISSVIKTKPDRSITLQPTNPVSPAGTKTGDPLTPVLPFKAKTLISKATTYAENNPIAAPLHKLIINPTVASAGAGLPANHTRATKHEDGDLNNSTVSVIDVFNKTATTVTKIPAETVTQAETISIDSSAIATQRPLDSTTLKTPAVTDSAISLQQDAVGTVATGNLLQHHNKKFDWGITFTAGSSGVSTAFPGVFEKRLNDAPAYSNPQTTGSGNINSSASGYTTASPYNNHFAWSVGIVVRKSIGKTWKLISGMNYSSYATSIQLGGKTVDSLVPGRLDYRNNRSETFTNHAHFIEVPLMIEKRLGMHSRFSLNGGLAVSLLTATNQLRFDQQANLYYADKSVVDKTQLSFLLGLNYKLIQKKMHLETGPLLRYQLQDFYNKDIPGNGHWFFAGIGATIFFDKRKK